MVATEDRKRYLIQRMRDHLPNYVWDQHIVTVRDIAHPAFGRGMVNPFRFPEVGIDDVEDVFQTLFQADLEFVTASATWIPLAPTTNTVKAETVDDRMIDSTAWDGDFAGNEAGYPVGHNPYLREGPEYRVKPASKPIGGRKKGGNADAS